MRTFLNINIWPASLIALLLMIACNPTKDKKINRRWHTLTGHYNVYFNGEQKYISILDGLEQGTPNDFTKTLPIFCYGDEAAAKSAGGQLDEVIKKASKSIQNHTVGDYTDDSYLLMGKAHFLKHDYYAALEVFQYVNSKYKDKGLRPIATAWIAKCYVGLKKDDEAEAVIGLLISEFGPKVSKGKPIKPTFKEKWFPPLPDEYYREIYATAADIALKEQKPRLAMQYLQKALPYASTKKQKIRYNYILGQLFLDADSVKLANKYFTQILSMNAPYEFEFNASINIARAYDPKNRSAVKKVRRSLKSMLKDDKNDGLYDQIYYELGNLEMKEKNLNEAIKDYKLSIAKSTKNPNQKALSYLALGNIYLNLPDYKLAQAYYDSTAGSLSKDYKDYKKIIDKKELLSELISNLIVIESEDSLQAIAKLSKPAIEAKIDEWIAAEKNAQFQKAKDAQRQKALAKLAEQNQQLAPPTDINSGFGGGEAGQWYFYNQSLLASGAADFFSQRKWGRRANDDFWRLSNRIKEGAGEDENGLKSDSANAKNGSDIDSSDIIKMPDISQDRQAWIKDVPFSKEQLQQSNTRMLDAYYNIGVLYDEKLNDYKESTKDFEAMNDRFPANAYEPEVLYRLHKIYLLQKDTAKSNYAKAILLTKYPNSPYALILQNKLIMSSETDANKEVVLHYEAAYEAYLQGDYAKVKDLKKDADKKFPGNSLKPKYDLLNALAIGKTDSLSKFKSELQLIVTDYPKTDVADRAQNILNYIKKQEAGAVKKDSVVNTNEQEFVVEPNGPYYFIFATKEEKFDNNEGLTVFNKYNEDYGSLDNLRVNNYESNEGYQMIMVREFTDYKKAQEFLKGVVSNDIVRSQLKFTGKYLLFVVSMNNFKKLLKEQKVDVYYKIYQDFVTKTTPPKQ